MSNNLLPEEFDIVNGLEEGGIVSRTLNTDSPSNQSLLEDFQTIDDILTIPYSTNSCFDLNNLPKTSELSTLLSHLCELMIRFDSAPNKYQKADYEHFIKTVTNALIYLYTRDQSISDLENVIHFMGIATLDTNPEQERILNGYKYPGMYLANTVGVYTNFGIEVTTLANSIVYFFPKIENGLFIGYEKFTYNIDGSKWTLSEGLLRTKDGTKITIQDINEIDSVLGAEDTFLNKKGEFVTIQTSSIGVTGSELYMSIQDSDVAGYKLLSNTIDTNETEITITANSADGIVWGNKYLTPEYTATTIPTKSWGFDYWRKVSTAINNSSKRLRVFIYRGGVETDIITLTSPDINDIDFTERQVAYVLGAIELQQGDRIGVQAGFSTTRAINITLTYIIGDGRGWFMRVPLAISHKDLDNKNAETAFQHIDTTKTKETLAEADKVPIYDSVTGKVVLTDKTNVGVTDIISTNVTNNSGIIVIDTTPNWQRVNISSGSNTLILDYENGVLPTKNREYLLVIDNSHTYTKILTLPTNSIIKNGITYNFKNTAGSVPIEAGRSIEVNVIFFFTNPTTCNIRTQITQFI